MTELQVALKIVLANTFLMYFKAHSYHWNVEGPMFPQYHDFFGDLYEELHGAIDIIAEQARALDDYGPANLAEMYKYRTVQEDPVKPSSVSQMLGNLLDANQQVTDALNKLFNAADQADNQGLADFAAGRLDAHAKHAWMIKSSMKVS